MEPFLQKEFEDILDNQRGGFAKFKAFAALLFRTWSLGMKAGYSEAFPRRTSPSSSLALEYPLLPSICAIGGLLLIVIGLPVAVTVSFQHEVSLVDLLLFKVTTAGCVDCAGHLFPAVSIRDWWALGVPLVVFFGATGVAGAALLFAGISNQIAIMAWGLYLGLFVTLWLSIDVLGIMPKQPVFSIMTGLRCGYILLLLYVTQVSPYYFARNQQSKVKYDVLCQGLFGIGAAWMLARIYNGSSDLLAGGLFLFCYFMATTMSVMATTMSERLWAFNIGCHRFLWSQWTEDKDMFHRLNISEPTYTSGRAVIAAVVRTANSDLPAIFGGVAIVFGFPFLVMVLYVWLLAGIL